MLPPQLATASATPLERGRRAVVAPRTVTIVPSSRSVGVASTSPTSMLSPVPDPEGPQRAERHVVGDLGDDAQHEVAADDDLLDVLHRGAERVELRHEAGGDARSVGPADADQDRLRVGHLGDVTVSSRDHRSTFRAHRWSRRRVVAWSVVTTTGAPPSSTTRCPVSWSRSRSPRSVSGSPRARLVSSRGGVAGSRVEPPCPFVAAGCGGCDLQHATLDLQRSMKEQVVRDALQRIGRRRPARDPDTVELPGTGVPHDGPRRGAGRSGRVPRSWQPRRRRAGRVPRDPSPGRGAPRRRAVRGV